jgi:hypothetical protein
MWLKRLGKNIFSELYDDDFPSFKRDLMLIFDNALLYSPPPNDLISEIVEKTRAFAMEKLNDFARSQMKSARRHAYPSATPVTFDLVEKLNAAERIKSLHRSNTTLIIVPIQLLQHWEFQILQHVDTTWVGNINARPGILGSTEGCHVTRFRNKGPGRNKSIISDSPTKRNFLFIDYDRSSYLPDAYMLAKFDFVVTSVERLSNEWKRGHKISTNNYDFPSPLLKINFLRVVVDEVRPGSERHEGVQAPPPPAIRLDSKCLTLHQRFTHSRATRWASRISQITSFSRVNWKPKGASL